LGNSLSPPPPASPTVPPPAVTGSNQFGGTPLTPPPMQVPGGGTASLGGPTPLGPPTSDPDRAFNPRESSYRPAESTGARPQPGVRRTGPRPVPNYGSP